MATLPYILWVPRWGRNKVGITPSLRKTPKIGWKQKTSMLPCLPGGRKREAKMADIILWVPKEGRNE